ncbi:hypothetical protein T07_14283 [Trichinella nelsoni]|uniref:Uncharacterized protein n=1 Tax=Trichinella nelsoni TaxID=6336 RepID=A0A0V0SB84_9BILA|nr:hypothetical protein T07_14283 [Trichinella nelsoni]
MINNLTIHTLSSLIRIGRILICPFSQKLPSSIRHSTLDDFSIVFHQIFGHLKNEFLFFTPKQPKQVHQIAFFFIKEETFKIKTVTLFRNVGQQRMRSSGEDMPVRLMNKIDIHVKRFCEQGQ